MKQDKTEAVMAVSGRLEFIEKEMPVLYLTPQIKLMLILSSQRIEKQIQGTQEKAETIKMDVSSKTISDDSTILTRL